MITKPKLLIVADTYYPKVDGTLRFMEEFTKRAAHDFEISLLVPDLGRASHTKMVGVSRIMYIKPSRWISVSGYPSMKLTLKNIRRIKTAVKDAELVFAQGPALISYLSIYYGRKYNKKTFFYTHTIAWELFEKFFPPLLNRLFFKLISRLSIFFYNKCTDIFIPYHELQGHLRKEGVKTHMSVARLGVDIVRFSPSKDKYESKKKVGISGDSFVIGYVGRISKEKNTKILLEGFAKLKNRDKVQLLLVGDGPAEQKKECQALRNCAITGFVPNVEQYLKAMDVFVMPSLTETTSLATLEAMSCGVPIIASKVGFMKKYIIRNHNGVFFPRNSAAMLAVKLEKIREDAAFRRKLERNARKTVAYSFSWERSVNKIKRLLLRQHFQA